MFKICLGVYLIGDRAQVRFAMFRHRRPRRPAQTEGFKPSFLRRKVVSAFLYAEIDDDKPALANDKTYVLMPHVDNCLRQVRMKCIRRLSLDEYRMSTHTAIRAGSPIVSSALQEAGELILCEELMADL
jgi:hypothetical protein